MPKIKWGGDLKQSDIDNARTGDVYAGIYPRGGVYRFRLKSIKRGTSNSDNPKATVFAVLDGTWKAEHEEYDGCPMWDHLPLTKSSAFRAKALCEALGVTSADLLTRSVEDKDQMITMIGDLDLEKGEHLLYVNVEYRPAEGEYGESIRPRGAGYLPAAKFADEPSPNGKAAKGKKAKKGKGKQAVDDEPPF